MLIMLTVLAVVLLLVMVSVMLHYEALLHVSSLIKRLQINSRLRVVYGVMGALIAHVSEVMVFAFGYYFLIPYGQYGTLVGKFSGEFRDCAYLLHIPLLAMATLLHLDICV
jgi:hypothetical protein